MTLLRFPDLSTAVCTCGHAYDTHDHYRKGTDCGSCGAKACPKFKRDKNRTEALPGNVIPFKR